MKKISYIWLSFLAIIVITISIVIGMSLSNSKVIQNTGLNMSGYNVLDTYYLGGNTATTSRTYLNVGGAAQNVTFKSENIDLVRVNVWQIAASGTDAVIKIWPLYSTNGVEWYRTTTTVPILWPSGTATTAGFSTYFEPIGAIYTRIEFTGLGTTSAIYAEVITKQVNY